jgi:hypothetical protein
MIRVILDNGYDSYGAERAILSPLGVELALHPCRGDAFREERRAVAGLDMFETEPLPMNRPLREVSNVILTDHSAWYSRGRIADLQRMSAEEAARPLRGEAPLKRVNP